MKYFCFYLVFLMYFELNAQISINQNDMPNINDTLRVSISSLATFDTLATGENYIWNFSDLMPLSQRIDSFVSVSSTLQTYNLAFGLSFDPNKATIAYKNLDAPTISDQFQMDERYDFYRETSTGFYEVGFGAQINSLAIPIKYDTPLRIYSFPINFQNTDSSESSFSIDIPNIGYWGEIMKRKNISDGWGTVTTPFGTFDAIRLKTRIDITDTIYIDSTGQGISMKRPTYYEYKWLTKNNSIPIITVTVRNMIYSVTYRDSLRNTILNTNFISEKGDDIKIFPNPATDNVSIYNISGDILNIMIYDISGKEILKIDKTKNSVETINTSFLNKGMYFLSIKTPIKNYIDKLIIK